MKGNSYNKILFYGGYGFIGNKIIDYIYNDFEIFKSDLKLDGNMKEVEKEILSQKPDCIMCSLGRIKDKYNIKSNQDYLNSNLKINLRDNLLAPLMLATISNKLKIHMIYIGTCAFYDSKIDGKIFKEEEDHNFFETDYSKVKSNTDYLISNFDNVLNLRISMPVDITPHPNNLLTKLKNYNNVTDLETSITIIPDLFPHINYFIKNKILGTINFVNPGTTSCYKIKLEYEKHTICKNIDQIIKITNNESECVKNRSYNKMSTEKLVNLVGNIVDVNVSVTNVIEKYLDSQNYN